MVRIHQGALSVTATVLSDLLGTFYLKNQPLCAEVCADLTQAQPHRGCGGDFRAPPADALSTQTNRHPYSPCASFLHRLRVSSANSVRSWANTRLAWDRLLRDLLQSGFNAEELALWGFLTALKTALSSVQNCRSPRPLTMGQVERCISKISSQRGINV